MGAYARVAGPARGRSELAARQDRNETSSTSSTKVTSTCAASFWS